MFIILFIFNKIKQEGSKFICLIVYDSIFFYFVGKVGVEVLLVGDFFGNVLQGYDSIVFVILENMIYYIECV